MKNKLGPLLTEAKRKGVNEGLFLAAQIALLAMENTISEKEMEVDESFFRDVETEMNRIYEEVLASVPSGEVTEMAEKVDYYVNEIRERRHMDDR